MAQLTITANATDTPIRRARKRAIDDGKSLRVWAGEVIEKHLSENRRALKRGPKLKP